jgi:hypothetical protein
VLPLHAGENLTNPARVQRLGEDIVSTAPDRFERQVQRWLLREKNHGDLSVTANALQKLEAGSGVPHIQKDQIPAACRDMPESFALGRRRHQFAADDEWFERSARGSILIQ